MSKIISNVQQPVPTQTVKPPKAVIQVVSKLQTYSANDDITKKAKKYGNK
jgi:hypothetical protein